MTRLTRLLRHAGVLVVCLLPAAAQAQSAKTARLVVTVVDPSGALVAGATVRVIGVEPGTKDATVRPIKTSDAGTATFDGLLPGRYSIQADFPGFELGLVAATRLQAGDNKRGVVLPIKKVQDAVTVGVDRQATASTRAAAVFGLTLTKEEIDALSDDPTEMARQLADLAGSDAIIRVDSFEGQQLPPRAQIKSIHVTRDQFAAETETPGSTFVDVITQAGVGPLRGGFNSSFHDARMSAKSPFTPTNAPAQTRSFGGNIGGTIARQKADFSLSINGSTSYSTPILNVVLPSGTQSEVLGLRQPFDSLFTSGLFNYAPTKDQTLRLGFSQSRFTDGNVGVGAYDLLERAYSTESRNYGFRVMEAGPIGRRMFINSRLSVNQSTFASHSATDAATIVVQDAFTSGGAQQKGGTRARNFLAASDVDYVRGIHSWRAGVQINGGWFHSDESDNQLGTYTFSSVDAYEAGQPILFTRTIGDPTVSYFNAQTGIYLQDDVRVRKGLTLSPGVRYSIQTHVGDRTAFEPRFGVTWAPAAGGHTTYRASGGFFHGWLSTGTLAQTLRFDGTHERELVVTNPSYPDPGTTGVVPPTNEYLLGNYQLQKNLRLSGGVDHTFSQAFRMNVLFNYFHQMRLPRGQNLNALANGVRPDPDLANVIEVVTDGQVIRHELFVNFNVNLGAGTAGGAARKGFDWRRLTVNGTLASIRARRNAGGPFYVSPSGTLDTEWGRGPADQPYRLNFSVSSNQIRNLTLNLSVATNDGSPYTLTTGFDDNQDGIVNDRPAGVGLNTLRTTRQMTLSLRTVYAIPLGRGTTPTGPARYRLNVFANLNNLTNHANLSGFSGVMTSPFFLKPTRVNNPFRVDVGMNLTF